MVVAVLLWLATYQTSYANALPSLGENSAINIERETRLGRSVYEQLLARGYIETNPILDRYINELGFRLLAGLDNRLRDYRFFIIRDDSVNAFALPGGYIGINRGLIRVARTQHQLASVIAHEIAHVRLRHGMDSLEKGNELNSAAILSMIAGILVGATVDAEAGAGILYGGVAGTQQAMVNFTRENEYEADRVGMELIYGGQFDPNGMVEMFTILTRLAGDSELSGIEYLRTHPIGSNRIAEARGRIRKGVFWADQIDHYQLFKDYLLFVSTDYLPNKGSPYLQALARVQAADYRQADRMLGELYHQDAENIWFSIAYADNLEQLGRQSEAEQVYRRLLDIFPGDYVLSLRLLRLLKDAGQYESALAIARRLENEYPEDQRVYFELSAIYESLNKPALQMMAEAEYHRITGNSRQAIKLYDQILLLKDANAATKSKAREKRLQLLE